jgi:uncharacterized damage-inducible protein DinB
MNNYFSAQAHNNAWANHRLAAVCMSLSNEALNAPCGGFFPSIIATLNHILIVDWYYVSALEGDCVGPSAFEPEVPFVKGEEYAEAQKGCDARLVALCEDPTLAQPGRRIHLPRSSGLEVDRFDRVFLHLIQHQIHHRGQVHSLLSAAGTAPPQLDEFYLSWAADKALRANDLSDLGTSEDAIWGGC